MKAWVCCLVLLLPFGLGAEQKAHQHGVASATLVIDPQGVEWQMDIPADQLFGFEHAPTTPQQHAVLKAQLEKIQPHLWLVWPDEAQCQLKTAELALEDTSSHHHDYVSRASWQCAEIGSLTQLDIRLFQLTLGLEQLQVQYITPAGQGSATLTPENHRLEF